MTLLGHGSRPRVAFPCAHATGNQAQSAPDQIYRGWGWRCEVLLVFRLRHSHKVLLIWLLVLAFLLLLNAYWMIKSDELLWTEVRRNLQSTNQLWRQEITARVERARLNLETLTSQTWGDRNLPSSKEFSTLTLVSAAGSVLVSTHPNMRPGADLTRWDLFQGHTVTDLSPSGGRSLHSFFVAARRSDGATLVGECALGEDFTSQAGEHLQRILLNQEGSVLLTVPKLAEGPSSIDVSSIGVQTAEAGVGVYHNALGEKVAGAMERVTPMRWTAITEIPESQAMRGFHDLVNKNRGLNALVLLIVTLLAFSVWRYLFAPLTQLRSAISAISAGDLQARVDIRTNDEIEELGQGFNQMAGHLQGLLQSLEEKVNERTQELDRANQELLQANQLKTQFLANMSHELRTPLNAILGFSELLADEIVGPLNEDQHYSVDDILESGRHLLGLINNLLDLSKIEAGRLELHKEPLDLAELAEGVVRGLTPLAAKKEQSLTVQAQEGLPVVLADPGKLKQILINLINNAIKFTGERGEIRVEISPVAAGLRLAVRDNGVGISPQDLERVFEEFHQADGSYTRQQEGTGLGLALTRKLLVLHGSQIQVESTLGQGSVFWFELGNEEAKGEELENPGGG